MTSKDFCEFNFPTFNYDVMVLDKNNNVKWYHYDKQKNVSWDNICYHMFIRFGDNPRFVLENRDSGQRLECINSYPVSSNPCHEYIPT